jgi:4-hydroxy-3-methylbut-2-en-1-yl diphosphate reductase
MAAEGQNLPTTEQATLLLLQPRGFCAGVIRAIEIVELALENLGWPVCVRTEIVHNRHVVEDPAARGAVFVESLEGVPSGTGVIFSGHGVSPSVRRGLYVIDATCPLVTKVLLEVIRHFRKGYSIILIGHRDDHEVIGTLGEPPQAIRVGFTSIREVEWTQEDVRFALPAELTS